VDLPSSAFQPATTAARKIALSRTLAQRLDRIEAASRAYDDGRITMGHAQLRIAYLLKGGN
jgi:hypothetical protein